jgi:pSer/pThr/pTyr-binding forkhead associated (FHA) protein
MDVGLVCDACSALTPIGVPQCARCGSPVALDPRPRSASNVPAPVAHSASQSYGSAETMPCPKCHADVVAGHRFCHNCGARMPEPFAAEETKIRPSGGGAKSGRNTLFFGGAVQQARAKLTLIRGDGEDGVSFTLAGEEHLAGRGEVPISFPDDPFLSPMHANFIYLDGQLSVRDEGSLNGIYVRISGRVPIALGGTILVGEQVLVVDAAKQLVDAPDADGTFFSATMPRKGSLQIVQNLRGGITGWAYRTAEDVATIGREGNDINFPEDPFISGRHAELRLQNGVLSVTDLGSRNGTFVRVDGEGVLRHGDYVFLGQQLLRVEIV